MCNNCWTESIAKSNTILEISNLFAKCAVNRFWYTLWQLLNTWTQVSNVYSVIWKEVTNNKESNNCIWNTISMLSIHCWKSVKMTVLMILLRKKYKEFVEENMWVCYQIHALSKLNYRQIKVPLSMRKFKSLMIIGNLEPLRERSINWNKTSSLANCI